MSKKILIIPDVHGRRFWRLPLKHIEEYEHVVFLGDYLDPYTWLEGITIDDAFGEFYDILMLKQAHPGKITLLLGNHDLHYYWPDDQNCSRRCEEKKNILHKIYRSCRNYFALAYRTDINGKPYIFTHAGILSRWMQDNSKLLVEYMEAHPDEEHITVIINWLNGMLDQNDFGLLRQVGYYRGGYDDYGSPIWADIHEHQSSEPLPGVYQIFGHTISEEPTITPDYAMLDCAQAFELSLDDGKITQYHC